MALRFRKSIKIAPGLRINLGKNGISASAGPRGASISIGQRGIYGNLGLPGTGLSYRTKLSGGATSSPSRAGAAAPDLSDINLKVTDDGELLFLFVDGQPLPPKYVRLIRKEHEDTIMQVLTAAVAQFNADLDECLNLHQDISSPGVPSLPAFNIRQPEPPILRSPSFLDRLLNSLTNNANRIEQYNHQAQQHHEAQLQEWAKAEQEHQEQDNALKWLAAAAREGDSNAMEQMLEYRLSLIAWPKETLVAFHFNDHTAVALDVDLPDLSDMPTRSAHIPARANKVTFKKRTDAQVRRDFSRLAHGTLFRLAGECFHSLPSIQHVTASAYVQRPDPATGVEHDVYVLSVRLSRKEWRQVDIEQLEHVDPEIALTQFEHRKSIDRSANMRAIEPF